MQLRQSTAVNVIVGPVLDASGVAVTTAVIGDFKLAKAGGAPAALNASATATHRHTGYYSIGMTTSDTDTVATLTVTLDKTTDAMQPARFQVIEEAVYDGLYASGATLLDETAVQDAADAALTAYPVATLTETQQAASDALTAAGFNSALSTLLALAIPNAAYGAAGGLPVLNGSGDLAVDATKLSGDATAADNAEAFFDGTGYAGTNNVIPTVTNVTNLHGSAATAANQTTLLNRIGAFTGTGVNTILGFLKAIMSKGASIPSDVGGTFNPATDAIEAITDNVPTDVWAYSTRILTAATNISGPIADQVWEETLSDHTGVVGSTAAALNAAGSAGDPWNTALPGSYGAGTAGKIIGDNIDALISSRLATVSYTAPDNAGIADILDDTGTTGVLVNAAAKSGYSLSATGLDLVLVESGITAGAGLTNDTGTQLTSINARQALSVIVAASSGVYAGANTTSTTIKPGAKPSGNNRIQATTSASGRDAVTLKVPD